MQGRAAFLEKGVLHEGMKGEGVKDLKPYSLGTKRELGYNIPGIYACQCTLKQDTREGGKREGGVGQVASFW